MKPRTKLQNEVIYLSNNYLKDITYKMRNWGAKECLEHKGFATKERVICMDCGQIFSPELVKRKTAICPHCHTKIKVEQSRKRTDKQRVYFAIAEIYDEFQVIRNFELNSYHKVGERVYHSCYEILQHWIHPNGKREVVGRQHTTNYYCDCWGGAMEIRKHYPGWYSYSADKYDVYPYKYHPDSEFKQLYKMYGINHQLEGLTFVEALKIIPNNPKAETLLKAKQYSLLSYCNGNSGKISNQWASIKICIRNKYTVKDASIWMDYLDLLWYFCKDLHNAKYVCPKNLKKEHDKLVAKKREIQRKEELERKKKRAAEDEKKFQELKKNFFGIEFSDGIICVKVLSSVDEYVQEGDKLHHCVFTNNYHTKKDSLILSARINGEPVETIEINLKTMKVEQCRGKFNSNTEHHDNIVNLVNKNMSLIRNVLRKPKKVRTEKIAV